MTGKGNWQAFFTKFARYAEVCEWGPQECKDQLCWCLEGKASEYYALITERDREVSYRELVEKLHKRFGFKALPETAQVQFNNARQAPEESLEDWADRVLSLATRAFRNLPDDYMYEQAVMRLCQGIENKQLGVQISNLQPQSIEEAIDKIRLFQHNTQAIYGKPNRREVRQVTYGQYGDHHEAFREYQGPHVRDTMALERARASTWKVELEKSDKKFENKLGQVHEKLDDMMDQFKQLLTSPIAGSCLPGRQTGTESCHHCGEGPFQNGMPKWRCLNVSGTCWDMVHGSWTTASPSGYLSVEEISKRTQALPVSLSDIHKLIKVDVDRRFTLIKAQTVLLENKGQPGVFLDCVMPSHTISRECECPRHLVTVTLLRGDRRFIANIGKPIGAILAVDMAVAFKMVCHNRDNFGVMRSPESWDSTSDGEDTYHLVEGQ
ncbi:Hypothetical predicted protein [Mytilus galloprovincialis]|uniref:Retrotransposon gag domain-containing protein n=1 Tax=Mytilus galloprovincialis TaxID=29158 RepID=A0A8B6BEG9_MYTGA|nr:Hypothetical predicted protein [Mytilus galloprovincialis]